MSDRLNAALNKANNDNTTKVDISSTSLSTDENIESTTETAEDNKPKITTTQEELDGFAIVKAILHKTLDVNRIFIVILQVILVFSVIIRIINGFVD